MNKILLFNGSTKEFKKKIPQNYELLTEVIYKFDEEQKNSIIVHHIPGQNELPTDEELSKPKQVIEHFVIFSSEFSGVREHIILNFSNFISRFDIRNLYIQNPPIKLKEQLQRIHPDTIIENETYNLIKLEHLNKLLEEYDSKVVGQPAVKNQLATAIFPLTKKYRQEPIVIMFYGKSGIGKTETAKFLSELVGQKLFRKQFSMYHNENFATYLFGGKHHQDSFAKNLLERESNILLLDEFDKANPMFHSAFYQLFDEGVFEDSNYSVKCQKTIIICTANYNTEQEIEESLGSAIYNRFDKLIFFEDLTTEAKLIIADREYDRLSDALGISLSLDVKERLMENVQRCDNVRQIQHLIEGTLSYVSLLD